MVYTTLYIPKRLISTIDEEAKRKGWSRNKYIVKVLEVFKVP